ncbi:MAG: sugar phosphate isomerase/epimerase family protein, partial [Planctomycetaceae bacterium]
MYVAASTHCFAEKPFAEACYLITDLEYDKIELWMSEDSEQLRPGRVAADPERYFAHVRETTRLTPIAIALAEDTTPETLSGVCRFAKLLRIAQV